MSEPIEKLMARAYEELKAKHPGCTIIRLPEENPLEIVCELPPESWMPPHWHSRQSSAIAVIAASEPHMHKETTEIYIVEKGTLHLTMNGQVATLKEGEMAIILPGIVHSAVGNAAQVRVISSPSWKKSDHHLVKV